MRKSERLAKLIGLPVEVVENEIDKGMWDILIELNKKNYFTYACCEGHIIDNCWHGYIAFKQPYKFYEYPQDYDTARQKKCFYWNGKTEDERKEFLNNLYKWAKSLPQRDLKEVKTYILWGRNKYNSNAVWKVLKRSNDYDEIRIELNRKKTKKYETDIKVNIVERY